MPLPKFSRLPEQGKCIEMVNIIPKRTLKFCHTFIHVYIFIFHNFYERRAGSDNALLSLLLVGY
jgi:hypothetical protein